MHTTGMRGDPRVLEEVEMVCALQDTMVRLNGGERGVRDASGIYFSLEKLDRFTSRHPFRAAAMFYHEFAQKHHFTDGNKRIAHLLAKLRLVKAFIHFNLLYPDAVPTIIRIAECKLSLKETESWIRKSSHRFSPSHLQEYLNIWLKEYTDIKRSARP